MEREYQKKRRDSLNSLLKKMTTMLLASLVLAVSMSESLQTAGRQVLGTRERFWERMFQNEKVLEIVKKEVKLKINMWVKQSVSHSPER